MSAFFSRYANLNLKVHANRNVLDFARTTDQSNSVKRENNLQLHQIVTNQLKLHSDCFDYWTRVAQSWITGSRELRTKKSQWFS